MHATSGGDLAGLGGIAAQVRALPLHFSTDMHQTYAVDYTVHSGMNGYCQPYVC